MPLALPATAPCLTRSAVESGSKSADGAPHVAHHTCAPFALQLTEAPGVVEFGGVDGSGAVSHGLHLFDGFGAHMQCGEEYLDPRRVV